MRLAKIANHRGDELLLRIDKVWECREREEDERGE
jgi:hypothetical protein